MPLRIQKTLTSKGLSKKCPLELRRPFLTSKGLSKKCPLELRRPLHLRGFQKKPLRIHKTLTSKGLSKNAP
jgi:hypothetical protein